MVWVPILMDVDPVEAVMSAAEDADMECLRMVLDRAPDLVVGRGQDGQTALMLAAKRGHSEVVQLLLEKGAVLGALDHDGRSAVHYAACNGHTQLLPSLLTTRADASRRDRNERTPLMLAACEGHVDAVWSLLGLHGFGADVVNARDVHGETALWKACGKGHYDVARLLLRAGADPHVPDLWEYKAMEVAGRYADVLKLIRYAGEEQRSYLLHRAHTLDLLQSAHTLYPSLPLPAYMQPRGREGWPMAGLELWPLREDAPLFSRLLCWMQGLPYVEEDERDATADFVLHHLNDQLFTELQHAISH